MKYQILVNTLQVLGKGVTKHSLVQYVANAELYLQSDEGSTLTFRNIECINLIVLYTQRGIKYIDIDKVYIKE